MSEGVGTKKRKEDHRGTRRPSELRVESTGTPSGYEVNRHGRCMERTWEDRRGWLGDPCL